jgi:hypothetical protein
MIKTGENTMTTARTESQTVSLVLTKCPTMPHQYAENQVIIYGTNDAAVEHIVNCHNVRVTNQRAAGRPDYYTHTNQTFSVHLTEGENQLLQHISRWGSDGYPVHKLGRKWTVDSMFGAGGFPTTFKTKREAVARFEAYYTLLVDRSAGRLE